MKNFFKDAIYAIVGVGLISASILACDKLGAVSTPTWEYQVTYETVPQEDDKSAQGFPNPQEDLNAQGKNGWELVSSYVENETVFPNLGDPKYITGVQPNVRPRRLTFILKRQKK